MNPQQPDCGASRPFAAFAPQLFKTPHLRNMYQKVGMSGMPATFGFPDTDNHFQGDQVRGSGFTHDGEVDERDAQPDPADPGSTP